MLPTWTTPQPKSSRATPPAWPASTRTPGSTTRAGASTAMQTSPWPLPGISAMTPACSAPASKSPSTTVPLAPPAPAPVPVPVPVPAPAPPPCAPCPSATLAAPSPAVTPPASWPPASRARAGCSRRATSSLSCARTCTTAEKQQPGAMPPSPRRAPCTTAARCTRAMPSRSPQTRCETTRTQKSQPHARTCACNRRWSTGA